jgi:chorismate dehydratase
LPKIINLNKYRIGLVSYTNTIPYIWCFGGKNNFIPSLKVDGIELEFVINNPAALANLMQTNKLDAALLPVASLLFLQQVQPITQFGIGCHGAVDSVCLFSNNALAQINTVLLDPQSKTSNLLTKILFKNYWQHIVNFEPAFEGYQNAVGNGVAAVVIGDRAFAQKPKNTFAFDLGYAWQQYTQLPFLFARFIAKQPIAHILEPILNSLLIPNFNPAKSLSIASPQAFDIETYLTKTIQYHISPQMETAMHLFLKHGQPYYK